MTTWRSMASASRAVWRDWRRHGWALRRTSQYRRRRLFGQQLETRWVLASTSNEETLAPNIFEPYSSAALQIVVVDQARLEGGVGAILPPPILWEPDSTAQFASAKGFDFNSYGSSVASGLDLFDADSITGFKPGSGLQVSVHDGNRADGQGSFAALTFQDSYRWSSTAFSGSGLAQGDGTIISWGVVADGLSIPGFNGEPVSPSNLRAFLGATYGVTTNDNNLTDEPWFPLFQDFFNRWGQVSGLEYRYEPNDDGAAFGSGSPGVVNVRADIRISGHYIDGQTGQNTLAYNFYPNVGDMVIDTSNQTFYANTSNNSISLRNVLSHEHGHGIGIEHVCPVISTIDGRLMEPFINLNFDGPQFDDILAAQRGYGDAFEKGLGNNTPLRAVSLGAVTPATPIVRGADGRDNRVAPTETGFLSIDDDSDIDFFQFTVGAGLAVDATLTPVGPTYLSGPQNTDGSCSAGTQFNASSQSDLALAILASDGSTVLHTASSQGIGLTETLSGLLLPEGTYYARVTGSANAAQMYELNLSSVARGGVFISETEGATAVAERGLADTYRLFLGTQPAGSVQVTITAENQLQVSLDGTTFGSTALVTLVNTSPVTVHIRAINDLVDEGDHVSLITHTITATNDPTDYPLSTPTTNLTVSIADNELAPFSRLTPLGSYISESTLNTGRVQSASDQADYRVTLAAGETFAAIVTPQNNARLALTILEASVTTTATDPGKPVVLPTFRVQTNGTYTLRVTGDLETSFTLRATRNAALEPLLGDTTTELELDLSSSALNLGGTRYAVVGYSQPNLYTSPTFVASQNAAAFIDLVSAGITSYVLGDTQYLNVSGVTVGNSYFPAGAFSLGGNGGIIAGSNNYLPDQNATLPANAVVNRALLPFWDDLTTGNVYVAEGTVNSIPTLIVQWQNRPHYDVGGQVTFQLQVFQSGPIFFRYVYPDVIFGNAAYDAGASATVGYQASSSSANLYSFNSASLSDGRVLDFTQPADVPDIDEYEIDLTERVGSAVDIALIGLDGSNFAGQTLQLIAPNGSVVATGSSNPVQLGTAVTNYQLGILGYVVPSAGIYTVRLTSLVDRARYAVVVTDQLRFDSEPNSSSTSPLRSMDGLPRAIGYLDATSDSQDRYQVNLTAGQSYLATTATPLSTLGITPISSLNPELLVIGTDGATVVASNQDGAGDGRNARILFVAPQTGTYQIVTQATSGSGEYRVEFAPNQTVALLDLTADQASRAEGDSGTTSFTFTVTRSGFTSGSTTVDYSVSGSGPSPATPSDFVSNVFPSGTISFSAGETTKTVTIPVRGELFFENNEGFTVTLSSPSADTEILTPAAAGTIQNDDTELILTEIMYDPNSAEPNWEWVEVYNPGPANLDLAGWVLDDFNNLRLPSANIASGIVAAGRTAILFNSSLTSASFAAAWGDTLTLIPVAGWDSLNNLSNDRVGLWRNFASYDGDHQTHTNTVVSVQYFINTSGWVQNNNAASIYLTDLTLDPSSGSSWARSVVGTAGAYLSTIAGGNSGNDIGSPGFVPGQRQVQIAALAADVNEGQSGDTAFTFQVARSGDTSTSSTIDYVVAGNGSNPANATDFGGNFPTGTITFAQNVSSITLTIPVRGDLVIEPDEGFSVTLINPPAMTEIVTGSSTAQGTIRNDDSRVSIQAADASRNEGDSGPSLFRFNVVRTGAVTAAASVQWSVSGGSVEPANAQDFAGALLPQGSVDFAVDETSRAIEVPVQGDLNVELDESFIVTLSNPTGGMQLDTATANASILNDDIDLTIEATNADRTEGNAVDIPTSFTFTIRRSGLVSGTTSVTYTVSGTGTQAANADDFGGNFPSQTVTFLAAETSRVVSIPVTGDRVFEPDETFLVTLSNPTGNAELAIQSAMGTIRDDDTGLSIVATDADKMEGNFLLTTFTFTVSRTGIITGQSTVNWSVSGVGTAPASAADFSPAVFPSGSLVFDPGVGSRTITIQVNGDQNYEPDEAFRVTLSSPVDASLTVPFADGTIRNDDAGVEIRPLLADRAEGNAGNTVFTFEVVRSGSIMSPLSLFWTITGSGSQPADGADFVGNLTGQLEFSGGESRKEIAVPVRGDLTVEPDEGFTITISFEFGGNVFLIDPDAEGVIRNDDTALSLQVVDTQKREGDSGTTPFQVRIMRTGLLAIVSSVNYSTTGTTANPAIAADFGGIFPSGTVTFTSGQSEQLVSIPVLGDLDVEADESFQVSLANATSAQLLNATGSLTIVNDDIDLSIESIDTVLNEGNTGSSSITFRVTRTGDVSLATTVNFAVTGSGANPADANDFGGTFPSGTVTFGVGSTMEMLTIQVSGDPIDEFDEAFTVTLSNPSGTAELVTTTAQAVIRNDDASPSISLSLAPDLLAENGGTATITATLTAISGKPINVDLRFAGTAMVDADYNGTSTIISLAPGVLSATITLTALQDSLDEPDETITFLINSATHAAIGANNLLTATVVDDDPPPVVTLSLSGSPMSENSGTATVTATIGAISAKEIIISLAFSGTATHATDYSRSATLITIPAGSTSGSITLTAAQDTLDEADETIIVDIDTVTNGSESGTQQVTATITDDDQPPTVTLSLTGSPLAEAAGAATVTATLSAPSGQSVTVQLAFSGTATLTDDYTRSGTTITIPAGSTTGSITLTAVQDTIDESDETIIVDVESATHATEAGTQQVTATIADDDFPTVSIQSGLVDRAEGQTGQTPFTFIIQRIGQLNTTGSVSWIVSGTGNNPVNASDFGGALPSGTASFATGESEKSISVMVSADLLVEADEQFHVALTNPVNLQIGTASATGTIRNDDLALAIAAVQANRLEGNTGSTPFTFKVTRLGLTDVAVEVSYAVSGQGVDAAQPADFANGTFPSGTIQFATNETEQVLTIQVATDEVLEPDEAFRVTLTNPSAGTVATGTADGRILNDDSRVLLIDDGDALYQQTGIWTRWTVYGGYASSDRVADMREVEAKVGAQATYRFQNLAPGTAYLLAATWLPYSNRSTQAPYTLTGIEGGSRTILVNQRIAPDDFTDLDRLGKPISFESLGSFTTDATGQVTVTLSSTTSGHVIADALKLTPITTGKIEIRQGTTRHPQNSSLDLGTFIQGGMLRQTFTVVNVGVEDLILQPASTTGAVAVGGSNLTSNQRLTPGQSSTITVELDANPLGLRSGTLTIPSNDPEQSSFVITLTATTVAALVIDDGDKSGFSTAGAWGHWAGFGGFAGEDRVDDVKESAANSGATATYTFPNLIPGASYQVSASWLPYPNRTTQAPYQVTGIEGGPQTVLVNQRNAPLGTVQVDRRGVLVDFLPLGQFRVDASGTLVVTLSSAQAGNTIADAIRIAPVPNVEVRRNVTTIFPDAPLDLGTRLRGDRVIETLTIMNRGSEPLVLQPVLTSGQVLVTGPNFTPNQSLAPGASQSIQIQIDSSAIGNRTGLVTILSNDLLMPSFQIPISALFIAELVIDDGDLSGFQMTGAWSTWVGYGGYSGVNGVGDVRETVAGTGAAATYIFPGLTPGATYRVSATWTPFTNRTTQAPYQIQGIVGGTQTALINQRSSPTGSTLPDQRGTATRFQTLGTYTVDTLGTLTVVIQAASVGHVIADAVSIAFVSGPASAQAATHSPESNRTPASIPDLTPSEPDLLSDTITQTLVVLHASSPLEAGNEARIADRLDAAQLIRAQAELAMLDRWLKTTASTADLLTAEPMIGSPTPNPSPFLSDVETPAGEGVVSSVVLTYVRDAGAQTAFQDSLFAILDAESLEAKLLSANQFDSFSVRMLPSTKDVGRNELTKTERFSTVLDVAFQPAQHDSGAGVPNNRDLWASQETIFDDSFRGQHRSQRMLPRRVAFIPFTFEAPRTDASRITPRQPPSHDIEWAKGTAPDQLSVDQVFAVWGVAPGHDE